MKSSNPLVSVMFVDIVGFSISAERVPAGTVFARLQSLLSDLGSIVQRHGGIVDKTIGDGFLSFFGCDYDGKPTDPYHVDKAIACACALQRFAADRAVRTIDPDEPVYPLRIGINTAPVFIGELEAGGHRESTIIGHGVNVAQRLEYACESFRVMLSGSTLGNWTNFGGGAVRIHKRQVQMKHRETVFDAFELDPFESEPEKLKRAVGAYRDRAGLRRRENRESVGSEVRLAVHPERVEARVVNFSRSGLALRTTNYFSRGTVLTISLEASSKSLAALCRKRQVGPTLSGEVRWGVPAGDDYLHGIEFVQMGEEEKERFHEVLTEYLASRDQRKAG